MTDASDRSRRRAAPRASERTPAEVDYLRATGGRRAASPTPPALLPTRVQVLKEDAEEAGESVPEPPEEAKHWSEAEVRAYFASGGTAVPAGSDASASSPAPLPVPDEALFGRWFPGLKLSGTTSEAAPVRVLCFHNAGNSEDMYTSEGTGVRRAPSPLLDWARARGVEVLAVQLPGRAARRGEPFVTTAKGVAAGVFEAVASRLAASKAWVAIGHSAGAWCTYEFLRLWRSRGQRPPAAVYLSAMASPSWPEERRPWRRQRDLDDDAFIDECRAWGVAELLFSPALWPVYKPIMRADFCIFDEYEWEPERQGGAPPTIDAPLLAFYGSKDGRISREMVEAWREVAEGPFRTEQIDGPHLWPLEKNPKADWLARIVEDLGKNERIHQALQG